MCYTLHEQKLNKMKNYRIGNIELHKSTSLLDKKYWEIVYWYHNEFYNKESEYNWDEEKQMYRSREHNSFLVSKSCFENPESCYSLAIFEDLDSEEPNVKSVGSRPFLLSNEDYAILRKIINYAYEHIDELKNL